jgi:hypothetical protein
MADKEGASSTMIISNGQQSCTEIESRKSARSSGRSRVGITKEILNKIISSFNGVYDAVLIKNAVKQDMAFKIEFLGYNL